jgi:hypothetical protein
VFSIVALVSFGIVVSESMTSLTGSKAQPGSDTSTSTRTRIPYSLSVACTIAPSLKLAQILMYRNAGMKLVFGTTFFTRRKTFKKSFGSK